MAGKQKLNDLLAGVLVEISGRFVGDHDCRIGGQRTCNRDTLLLAARKFGRIMVKPLT